MKTNTETLPSACWNTITTYHNHQTKQVNAFLKKWELSHTMLEVLRCLKATTCTSQKEIAQSIQVTDGTISQGVKKLFARQLIKKYRHRKINYFHLTPAGELFLNEVLPAYEAFQAQQFSLLSLAQQKTLYELVTQLHTTQPEEGDAR
ncbi:MarR family transcriptional regulator [Exiguobacterium sp. s193]|uniref:MarR family winged helix-turn-helix transcriptional regulator n=1 Tax=Exiguobacterium sp. s193 TaxID=2751207 RepID=UPI001BE5AFBD|nr:MarR family transcriptional regulator [Exiguobacterium sp. s193]